MSSWTGAFNTLEGIWTDVPTTMSFDAGPWGEAPWAAAAPESEPRMAPTTSASDSLDIRGSPFHMVSTYATACWLSR